MSRKLPSLLKKELARIIPELSFDLTSPDSTLKAEKVLACSQFVADYCLQQPQEAKRLIESGVLERAFTAEDFLSSLVKQLETVGEEEELMRVLRRFRNQQMVRIAWRDIAGLADLEDTMLDLSLLAEVMLDQTLARLHGWLADRFGEPMSETGEPQRMVIIGMGKLGSHELNFSSDIDLIFAFPEAGNTCGKKKSLDNQEFFVRLGKQLIRVFNTITEDGFVFRMDMRLRPFGESGALALNFDAMEAYYISHARDWERYAMIKANIVAGDREAGAQLMKMLVPFVYRRYLDYGAYQSIREMKQLIDREVLRKGMEDDVKLGAGGIREIEFIGQTFQLLRGGRDPALQERQILKVLSLLANRGVLSSETARELCEAYRFLRNTEHRIQEIADQQTQRLPRNDLDRARVAFGMGHTKWTDFLRELNEHRSCVAGHFAELLRTEDDQEVNGISELEAFWQHDLKPESAREALEEAGFADPEAVLGLISQWKHTPVTENISKEGRERLDRLMPLLLELIAKLPADDQNNTLDRLLRLVESIARRSVYLALLREHPAALEDLIKLCAASPWIAEYITNQPILLDELIDPETLYSPPDRATLEKELHDTLLHLSANDLERQMDALRHFRHSQVLRVAAADITGRLPLAEVSNHLTAIAEVVIGAASELAWNEMVERYGEPCFIEDGEQKRASFAIIGYGKLGGYELGYGSDLDVVFLHDSRGDDQWTNGKKQVDNSVFFNRLGQRLIHILTTMTPAGRTYEIDTRLRPSGLSGFLVTSLEAYEDYQLNSAWTWEHQALVRARPVTGEEQIRSVFLKIRSRILSQPRNEAVLKKEIREMREKMRQTLGQNIKGMFDLKQGLGGMADIEFIVQYNVLRWASEYHELLVFTDNLRLLEIMARLKLLKKKEAECLIDAYFRYRTDGHRLALQGQPAIVPEMKYKKIRQHVTIIWNNIFQEGR